jgi:hypothetical protein
MGEKMQERTKALMVDSDIVAGLVWCQFGAVKISKTRTAAPDAVDRYNVCT